MPKVTMRFKPDLFSGNGREKLLPDLLKEVGVAILPLIADAFSFGPGKLDPVKDIDWLPTPYPPGSAVYYPVSIEIQTIGYPGRKAKVTEEVVRQLKRDIVVAMQVKKFPGIHPNKPLLWVQYVDPEGLHV